MRLSYGLAMLLVLACDSGTKEPPAEERDAASDGTDSTDGAVDGVDGACGVCGTAGSSCTQGEALKDMELQNCKGEKVRLADIVCPGKAAVISFGAGWCQPCREKQPKLQKWYAEHHAQGLEVVTILKEQNGPGDPATRTFCEEWTTQYGLDFPVYIDPTDKVTTDCLGTGGVLPVLLVVAPDWRVVYKDVGGEAKDAEATFEELLQLCQ